MIATITMPRLLYIGGGAVAEVTMALARLGAARPLIVTDRFMESSGTLAKVTDRLDAAGLTWRVFSDTGPDPTTQVIDARVEMLKAGPYDALVSLRGRRPIGTAKGMSGL